MKNQFDLAVLPIWQKFTKIYIGMAPKRSQKGSHFLGNLWYQTTANLGAIKVDSPLTVEAHKISFPKDIK
jgi:hypothetical protein